MSPKLMDTFSFRRVLLVGLLGASATVSWSFLRPIGTTTPPSITAECQTANVSEPPRSAASGSFDELSEAPESTSEVVENRPAGIRIVNELDCPGERQICLRDVMAEVNRAAAQKNGLNLAVTEERGIRQLWKTTGATPSEGYIVALDNGEVEAKVKELKAKNFARSLAEPNLTAVNGMPANFLVGGQFPVPVSSATQGAEEVTYVPYGVQLNFTPYITKDHRIRLAVNMTISRRKSVGDDKTAPELVSRVFATTVELKQGQTMIVAGMNVGAFAREAITTQAADRTKGNSQTPSAEESDFVFLITPELVCHKLSNENQ